MEERDKKEGGEEKEKPERKEGIENEGKKEGRKEGAKGGMNKKKEVRKILLTKTILAVFKKVLNYHYVII